MSSPTPEQRREAAAALLGVDADCDDEDEIKRAYRKLALRVHPDKYDGPKEEAEAKFKELSAAYACMNAFAKGEPDEGEQNRGRGGGGGGARDDFQDEIIIELSAWPVAAASARADDEPAAQARQRASAPARWRARALAGALAGAPVARLHVRRRARALACQHAFRASADCA